MQGPAVPSLSGLVEMLKLVNATPWDLYRPFGVEWGNSRSTEVDSSAPVGGYSVI